MGTEEAMEHRTKEETHPGFDKAKIEAIMGL
jgi:hypothetical protein